METIVGIDFGTTNSVVAFYDGVGVRVLPGNDGDMLLPSAVFIDEDGRPHVGSAARNVALLHPANTVMSVKRAVGSGRNYHIAGREYTPQQIAAFVFGALKDRCEQRIGHPVTKAVVSVPAYYDELKREAIKEAANLSGLNAVRLINEPTAAALAYKISGEGNVLVYDLGGGTFDVSVLQVGNGVYRVLASRGDPRLGGDDFDREIMGDLIEEFRDETGIDLSEDRLAMHKLRSEAERAKIELSTRRETTIEIPFIAANVGGACHLKATLDRASLEQHIRKYVDRTVRLTKGAITDAGVRTDEIEHVLLVGGSTMIPAIRRAIEKLMGRPPETAIDPERAVAEGAALEAGVIAGSARETVLVDVTPLGLGVESGGEDFVTLLPRNTVLPAEASAIFTTMSDFQRRARVTVLQGERPRAADNIRIGSLELPNIEQAPRGEPQIQVSFRVDVDGILSVRAKDLKTGSERRVELHTPKGDEGRDPAAVVEEAREAEIDEVIRGHRRNERRDEGR